MPKKLKGVTIGWMIKLPGPSWLCWNYIFSLVARVRGVRGLMTIILASSLISACVATQMPPVPTQMSTLVPYQTRTMPVFPTLTMPPSPTAVFTPTPVVYQVVANDTLSSIAKRFGISVDDLLAANPAVIPQDMALGQTLVIPPALVDGNGIALSTPVPLQPGQAFCRPSGTGTTCIIPVSNPFPRPLENIRLMVDLLDQQGQILESLEAILPLNVLPAGAALPAVVHFKTGVTYAVAQSRVLTAMLMDAGDQRYLRTELRNFLTSMRWDGLSAQVQGQVSLAEDQQPASSIWLVAVCYDKLGRMTGSRRWEWSGSLQPGASLPFSLSVYSLESAIEHVEIWVEARP